VDSGKHAGVPANMANKLTVLERENRSYDSTINGAVSILKFNIFWFR
jgi:hypothetical protein